MPDQPLTIVKLTAENVKRLRAVQITPQGNLVRITGANGAGKTSVLDAIWAVLGGKAACPEEPIRRGAEQAVAEVDLGAIRVRRRWLAGGNTYLEVYSADGGKFSSPQKILDELVGALAFDPLEFVRMEPREQRGVLLDLLGIDDTLAKLDGRRRAVYDQRSELAPQVRMVQGELAGLPPVPDDTPEKPVSIELVADRLRKAQDVVRLHEMEARDVAAKADQIRRGWAEHEQVLRQIAQCEAELGRLRNRADEMSAELKAMDATLDQRRNALDDAKLPDLDAIQREFAQVDQVNVAVRTKARRRTLEIQIADLKQSYDEYTDALMEIDAEKARILREAKWPVAGLGFTDAGVTLNDLPFGQASQAEQLRASLAIAMAANPRLRVLLVRDGSLLDSKSMALIAESVQANGYQLWIEQVDESGRCGVVIEDGAVAAVNAEPVLSGHHDPEDKL